MMPFRFGREWRRALDAPIPGDRVLGPWEGHWESVGGHRGRLRCVVRRVDSDRLQAAFHAVFWKVFRASYAPLLEGREVADGFELSGEWSLGLLSVPYGYEGRITPVSFAATYRSKHDSGIFELRRP